MYLYPWRTEERPQYGAVIDLRDRGTEFSFNGKVNPLECKNGGVRNKQEVGSMRFDFFERKLHILVVVVVVEVLAQVMHGKEVGEGNFPVQRLVFSEMFEQQRHLVHLAERSRVQDDYK